MKLLDLFSGIGGFSLAAKWADIETIQFVEKDKFCQKVLMKNFPNVPIHDDIKTFNFYENVDILTGGFPCQPFSVAGKKKGFSDERYLWPEMLRIIQQCKPAYIIAENVAGIVPLLDKIIENLENEEYTCQSYLIPASLIGAPHKRERVWIIAYRNSERCYSGGNYWEMRQVFENVERHIQEIQSEWPQFIPKSWATFNAQDWLTDSNSIPSQQTHKGTIPQPDKWNPRVGYSRQDRPVTTSSYWEENQPPIPGVDDGLPNGVDRNKSLGNAIVPQIAYVFFKAIVLCGTLLE